ncbi:MAG: hypothetical protein JWN76_3198 [Chitinophagaceae bacterium]|nr:hypothetical protein [Chitinophagaceae bacterium]
MKFKNIILKTLLTVSTIALVFGCKKPAIPEQADGKGSTIVRMPPGSGYKLTAIDLVTTSQTFGLVDVYRDAPGEDALNSTTKVVITEDPAVITAYNTARGTSYIPLPPTTFTPDASNPKSGNDYSLTFGPGEFYKQLKITVPNATALDPNKKYALGFKITSVDNNGKISASEKQVVVEVGIKNKWDGVYTVNGTMVDLTASTITGYYPLTFELRTTGSNTLAVFDKSQGTQTHLILSGGGASQYGTFGLNITIDPATNKVTGIVNSFGQPSANGRSAALDPTGVNAYDPATKTFRIKYFLLQPGTTVRTTFDETWVFSGVR